MSLATIIITLFTFVACSEKSSAKRAFEDYSKKWIKKDFKGMYSMISAKSRKNYNEKDFIDRYTVIYKGIEAQNILIKMEKTDEINSSEGNAIKIPFSVIMNTCAGKLNLSGYEAIMVKEKYKNKSNWKLVWNEKMIFPRLEHGDKVKITSFYGNRGEIYDRNGKALAINSTIVTLGIHPSRFMKNKDSNIAQMASILDIDPSLIENKLKASTNPEQFLPIINISITEKEKIKNVMKLEGVIQNKSQGRIYPGGEAFGSLIGYVAPITAEELSKHSGEEYNSTSLIGKAGLEQIYEKRLRGKNGAEIYISKQKDGSETDRIPLCKKDPKDGENIKLSIDFDLQNKIYAEMNKNAGACTAINPKNGQVLAMVSSPSYDSNAFTTYASKSQKAAWKSSVKDPFLNRFKNLYAPGSTFKLVTAAIGLSQGKIKPDETVNIQGKQWKQVTRVTDPGKPVNLQDAFVYSDNIYFAMAANNIGKENFLKGCNSFGIGESLPFDYPIGKSQAANNNDIKNDTQLCDSGYGQGEVLMSPLHMALIYSSVVNDGNIITPSLEINAKNTATKLWKQNVISKENVKILMDDLTAVIENPNGTGHQCKIDGIPLAGKTGTAELKKNKDDTAAEENGWFICMNTNDPKLVVSMVIEDVKNRGESHLVVPIVKNIMEYYLK